MNVSWMVCGGGGGTFWGFRVKKCILEQWGTVVEFWVWIFKNCVFFMFIIFKNSYVSGMHKLWAPCFPMLNFVLCNCVSWYSWVPSVELSACYPSGTWNFEVVHRFFGIYAYPLCVWIYVDCCSHSWWNTWQKLFLYFHFNCFTFQSYEKSLEKKMVSGN